MRALVTGGAKRLGREMALYLAARGYDVVVHYASSQAAADEVVAEIQALGRKAQALRADLLIEAEVKDLLPAAAAALGGPITCLIN
ncbi:MAG: SDR family NAD(P)-dependent oxidoreductase, partial [Paracoccaceae bacterium]|nr:SDR family NAD(P)-dependent oxidoreductase [Paracoccaceae bacterium]